jgi:hypothetical protein
MRTAIPVLMCMALVLLAGLIGMAIVPRATHAEVGTYSTIVPLECETSQQSGVEGEFQCQLGYNYTVPANRRLVMQQVTATCGTPAGKNVTNMYMTFTEQGTQATAYFPLISGGVNPEGYASFSMHDGVSYYADPGTSLLVSFNTTDATGSTACQAQTSGYLINYE